MNGRKCSVVECHEPVKAKDLCATHYQRWLRHGHPHDTRPSDWGARNKHPAYKTWVHLVRRFSASQEICVEWVTDFWTFARDVGERPAQNWRLVRRDPQRPYAPGNTYWREPQVSHRDADRKKALSEYSRRWRAANLRKAHDSMLRRHYGISIETYELMHDAQGGLCAICGKPEITIDHRTQKVQRLSVDHCHTTGKVRSLLCGKCNKGIAAFDEDRSLLSKAIIYLKKHGS